ncbi:MAG: peroxiredoxin [Parvibaculaceae bacterium]
MAGKAETGAKAPDISLPSADGKAVTLGEHRGRKIVLYFYPKDDTSGCTRQAIDFTALKKAFEAADTVVVGISPDSPQSHERFSKKHKLDLVLASDEKRSALEAYGVWTEKSMYGRKFMGVERSTFLIGRDGRIAQVWRKVKVPGHAAEVLGAAQALA